MTTKTIDLKPGDVVPWGDQTHTVQEIVITSPTTLTTPNASEGAPVPTAATSSASSSYDPQPETTTPPAFSADSTSRPAP